jgi:hypothetical protein
MAWGLACKIWIEDIEWMCQILGKKMIIQVKYSEENDWQELMVNCCSLLKNGKIGMIHEINHMSLKMAQLKISFSKVWQHLLR